MFHQMKELTTSRLLLPQTVLDGTRQRTTSWWSPKHYGRSSHRVPGGLWPITGFCSHWIASAATCPAAPEEGRTGN